MQPQPLQAQALGPPAVQRALAMRGIANDGVGDVLEVAADLVAAPGEWLGLHQGQPRAGKAAVVSLGVLQRGQARKAGLGRLGGRVLRGIVGAQRVVHLRMQRRPAAHHGQVALVHLVVFKLAARAAGCLGMQRQQQHAAGAFVEPVERKHMLAHLVAQGLHDKARLARIQARAVHQPSGRLVDGHQVLVAPQHGQGAVLGMGMRNSRVDGERHGSAGRGKVERWCWEVQLWIL